MIADEVQLQGTLERIAKFQKLVLHVRKTAKDEANFKMYAGGYLAELDVMQREVREFLRAYPPELLNSSAAN